MRRSLVRCLESRIDSSRRVGRDTVVECVPSVQYTVRFEPVLDPLPQRNIGRSAGTRASGER